MCQILKGAPRGIDAYIENAIKNNYSVVHFSASNGTQNFDIFSSEANIQNLLVLSYNKCRKFKKYIESSGTNDEIIYDRSPYKDLI